MEEGLMFIAIGVVMIIIGLIWMKKIKDHKSSCTSSCEGIVARIDKQIQHDDGKDTMMYTPVFTYSVNGNTYTNSTPGSSSYCKHKTGDKVKVFYNPDDPNKFYVKGDGHAIIAGAFLFMGIVFVVAVLLN